MTWERRIATGSAAADHAELEAAHAHATNQGLQLQVSPLQGGGFHVRAVPSGAFGQTPAFAQSAPQGFGAPIGYSSAQVGNAPGRFGSGGSGGFDSNASASTATAPARVQYLRKVYSLLAVSTLIAVGAGYVATRIGVTPVALDDGSTVEISLLTRIVLGSPMMGLLMFGLLFASTFAANLVADKPRASMFVLFGIAALLGVEAAPMLEVVALSGSLGGTLTSSPVRDASVLTMAVFLGMTGYVSVTKKDFSYLNATLNIGFWMVFGAALLNLFFHSEVFSLAIASVGALVISGMLLVHTSRIFRDSEMDNPALDALGLLIMVRNLLLFLVRILGSRRD